MMLKDTVYVEYCIYFFYVHIGPIQTTNIDSEARYSGSIGSTESGPIDVDIPEFSGRDGPIR